jgi:hypothetical protein
MGHPVGGQGNSFPTRYNFEQAHTRVGGGLRFPSTTREEMLAELSFAFDGTTHTIAFSNRKGNRVGNVCKACWGFRKSCTGTRIGQYVQGLDNFINGESSNSCTTENPLDSPPHPRSNKPKALFL